MEVQKCWFDKVCQKKELCNNCTVVEDCVRYNQMYLQTVNANIPGLFPLNHQLERPRDPSSPDWEVYRNLHTLDIQKFVENGDSLVIESSNCGNGKTTWAQRLLLKYLTGQLGKSDSGYFLYLPQAFFEVKAAIGSDKEERDLPYERVFTKTKLLVLDDVGHKKYSEYEEAWLLRVLSLRQLRGLATIYTMNSKTNLASLIGDRLYSRIYTASMKFYLAEKDKRSWDFKNY